MAGQLLILQVVIVSFVVLGVGIVTFVQNDVSFKRQESRRVLQIAESLAGNPVVNAGLSDGSIRGVPGVAQAAVSTYGASYVVVTDPDGSVLYSSRTDDRDGTVIRPDAGRQWLGVSTVKSTSSVEARVPIFDGTVDGRPVGSLAGYVLAGREYPTMWDRLGATAPTSIVYLALASLGGLGGSLLLSRRIKRQTLGLEPREIAGLVENREAMLHGLREGVIGIDRTGRVTLVNDEAARLLGLPPVTSGAELTTLDLPDGLSDVLRGQAPADDLPVVTKDRVLVINQVPVRVRDEVVGWVSTLRDHTELVDLTRQLDLWRGTTDTLRAQAHEFTNRMHTIAGLLELGSYDEAARLMTAESTARKTWIERVTSRVDDHALAALLIGKDSRARELGLTLDLTDDSQLPAIDDALSADLVTVMGNLVDNALEAASSSGAVPAGNGRVTVHLARADGFVDGSVQDNGPGVPDDIAALVFAQGFSTKAADAPGSRGWGLALSRMVCERRGGDLSYDRSDGTTTFVMSLPVGATSSSGTAYAHRGGVA